MRFSSTVLWTLGTIVAGAVIAFLATVLPSRMVNSVAEDAANRPGSLETVTGIPFSIENGDVRVTEELAHVRIPFSRTGLGKRLTLKTTFQLSETDVLEVGVRKSDFWLDYERVPLQHRILDNLAREGKWNILRSSAETVFLNPKFSNDFSSLDAFLAQPPTDGVIGLYGHTALDAPGVVVRPFHASDNPAELRAIYARYVPDTSGIRAPRERTIIVPLERAYQNPDGSFDVMYFSSTADGAHPETHVHTISAEISPAVPGAHDVFAYLKQRVRDISIRARPSYD